MHPDNRQFLAAKKELRSTKLQSSFLFYVCHQILNTEISFLRPSIFSSSTLAVSLSFSTCSSNLLATSLTVSALPAVSSMISEIFFTAATLHYVRHQPFLYLLQYPSIPRSVAPCEPASHGILQLPRPLPWSEALPSPVPGLRCLHCSASVQ